MENQYQVHIPSTEMMMTVSEGETPSEPTPSDPEVDEGNLEDDTGPEQPDEPTEYDNSIAGLGDYLKHTDTPFLKNVGASTVHSDNADLVGPFMINYDDINKDKNFKAVKKEKYDAVSKITSVTIDYLDGTSEPATIIQKKKGETKEFTNYAKLGKNKKFWVRNPHPEKEIINLHVELQKFSAYYVVEAGVATGLDTRLENEEGVEEWIKGKLEKLIKQWATKGEEQKNITLDGTFKWEYKGYKPQNLLVINAWAKAKIEAWYLELDIPVEVNKGKIEVEKKGKYNGGQEELLDDIIFALYCDPCGYVQEIVEDENGSYGTRIKKFTDDINEAQTWTTSQGGKLTIPYIYSGDFYTYRLIEVDSVHTEKTHYYRDRYRISESTMGTLGHQKEGENVYCTVEDLKLPSKEDISLTITNDRSSGDLILDKYDEEIPEMKLKKARFKIYVISEETEKTEEPEEPGDSGGSGEPEIVETTEELGETGETGETGGSGGSEEPEEPPHDLNVSGWLNPEAATKTEDGVYDFTSKMHDEYIDDCDGTEAGEFETNDDGCLKLLGVINGTYHIYETKGDWGYDIEGQTDVEGENYVYHGHTYNEDPDNPWVDIEKTVDVTTDKNHVEYGIPNIRTRGDLEITKVDYETGEALKDAEFKIKLVGNREVRGYDRDATGWLKNVEGNKYKEMHFRDFLTDNVEEAGIFKTDEEGKIKLEGIPIGRYKIYETKSAIAHDIEGQHVGRGDKEGDKEHDYIVEEGWAEFLDEYEVWNGYKTNEFTLHNDLTRGNLEFEKSDYTYKEEIKLEGAKFKFFLENLSECERGKDVETTGWLRDGKEVGNNFYEKTLEETLTPSEDEAGVYVTDKEGKIKITGIPNGTYHIYEIEMPIGYNMEEQDGYDAEKKWVDFGTVVVDSFYGENTGEENSKQRESDVDKERTYVDLYNRMIVSQKSGLTGFVWIDRPDINKGGMADASYDSTYGQGDETLSGIRVILRNKKDGKRMSTAYTGGGGRYVMTKWDADVSTDLHVDPEKDELYFWDLENAYIEFEYDNTTYVCVEPFVGGSASVEVNSKAQEAKMTLDELNDTNLTGTEGNIPGRAITKQQGELGMSHREMMTTKYNSKDLDKCGLMAYYNDDNYTVEFINLGLWKKLEPTYEIWEDIQYSKVKIRGYTYTYDYVQESGHEEGKEDVIWPSAHFQEGKKVYGAQVYPSDVKYSYDENKEGKLEGNPMEMYVVYKISIKNTTAINIPKIYKEYKEPEPEEASYGALFLDDLKNVYDSERFEISSENTGGENVGKAGYKGSQYFAQWQGGNGEVHYNLNDAGIQELYGENDKLSDGIKSLDTKSVYIQFKVKDEFLESMVYDLMDATTQSERVASETTTDAYHVYYRNDNLWYGGEQRYEGDNDPRHAHINSTIQGYEGEYLHRSLNKIEKAESLSLVLTLGDTRTIKGTVYEDIKERKNDADIENPADVQEPLGNGYIEDDETNRVYGVKVDLIDALECEKVETADEDNHIGPTLIYGDEKKDNKFTGSIATTTSDAKGNYSFEGVVPGLYYLRFTYPDDGGTELRDINGAKITDINSNDYKSTIINTEEDKANLYIKNPMETGNGEMNEYYDYTQKLQEVEGRSEELVDRNVEGNTEEEESKKAQKAKDLTEWYRNIGDNYNVGTDDFERRSNLGNYEYFQYVEKDEDGQNRFLTKVKDTEAEGSEAELDYEFYKVWSYTPYFSITIENTKEYKADVDLKENGSHQEIYTGFNLGLIETPKIDLRIDKVITNIRLTDSAGSDLSQRNPKDTTEYVTALDEIGEKNKYSRGSQYSRIEMALEEIYGSAVETTYTITLRNLSEQDFTGKMYNKYGEIIEDTEDTEEETLPKEITVTEVLDLLDPDYDLKEQTILGHVGHYMDGLDALPEGEEEWDYGEDEGTPNDHGSIEVSEVLEDKDEEEDREEFKDWVTNLDGKEDYVKYLSVKKLPSFEAGSEIVFSYTASTKLEENMDMLLENDATIASFKLDKGATLRTGYKWEENYTKTNIVITPDTGGDRRQISYIVIAVGLIVLVVGIVFIKKVILK